MGELISLDLYRARRKRRTAMRFAISRVPAHMHCVTCAAPLWAGSRAWQWVSREGELEAACSEGSRGCFPIAFDSWMEANRG